MDAESALDELARGGLRARPLIANDLIQSAWGPISRRLAIFQRSIGVPPELWDDCAQESLLRLWRARESYRGSLREEFWAWLFRICEREYMRLLERRGRTNALERSETNESPCMSEASQGTCVHSSQAEDADEQRAVDECVQALPQELRTTVELLYAPDAHSEREAAVMIGVSKSQVNVLRHRALSSMAECLRQKGIEP